MLGTTNGSRPFEADAGEEGVEMAELIGGDLVFQMLRALQRLSLQVDRLEGRMGWLDANVERLSAQLLQAHAEQQQALYQTRTRLDRTNDTLTLLGSVVYCSSRALAEQLAELQQRLQSFDRH